MAIRKTKKGYVVVAESTGRRLSKALPSKKAANKRLRQVEYFKRHKRRK